MIFRIAGVQPGSYSIRADATLLRAEVRDIQVGGALPVTVTLRMSAVAAEQCCACAGAGRLRAMYTRVTLGGDTPEGRGAARAHTGLQTPGHCARVGEARQRPRARSRRRREGCCRGGRRRGMNASTACSGGPDLATLESITVVYRLRLVSEFGFKSVHLSKALPVRTRRHDGAARTKPPPPLSPPVMARYRRRDPLLQRRQPRGINLPVRQRSARFLRTSASTPTTPDTRATGTADPFGW